MEVDKRSSANFFLLALYVLLYVVIPCGLILWGTTIAEKVAGAPQWAMGTTRLLLFFLVMPVHMIYLAIAINEWLPTKSIKALPYFIPFVLNALMHFLRYGNARAFLELWMLNSLPLFIGFQLCLIGGTMLLAKEKLSEDFQWDKVIFITILFSLFALPAGAIAYYGLQFHLAWSSSQVETIKSVLLYLISTIVIIVIHRRLLSKLYAKGEL